jgi:gluconolactonase
MRAYFILFIIIMNSNAFGQPSMINKTIGTIEKIDPALDKIVSKDAQAVIIAEGFDWSEGPLWVEKYKMLLFSDVPANTIYKWTEKKGKEVYLNPSGYTSTVPRTGEMGSNGLTLNNEGHLVLCQHGDRRMAKMDAPVNNPAPKFITLADKFDGKRLSSPNDAVYSNNGELYFTDPPYGLPKQNDTDPGKEIGWNGIYKVRKDNKLILLDSTVTRPNGIAFFPGNKKLIVACSDPDQPVWYIYDVSGDKLINKKVFYDLAGYDKKLRGLPDGLKIDKQGNVFATGAGGLYIFNKDGKLIGKLHLDNASSNCSLSADQKTIYITNDMYVLRFKMRN